MMRYPSSLSLCEIRVVFQHAGAVLRVLTLFPTAPHDAESQSEEDLWFACVQ